MNAQEFAQSIKAKYPQYKDLDDLELARRMVEKYPVYKDKVSFEASLPVSEPLTDGLFGSSAGENSPVLQKARMPEQVIRGTGNAMMDAFEPTTQSVPLNAALRLPQTMASIGSEGLASTFSPEGALMQGAAATLPLLSKPVNAVGRFIGKTAESTSGLGYRTPGVLADTVKDPTLFTGPGIAEAREGYKAIQNANQISPDLQRTSTARAFVEKALQFVDDGSITPDEALEARKALDSMSDDVPDIFRKKTREVFDAIAKQKFEAADKAYSRAVKSEALRSFWGINKGGTPSIVKGGILLGTGQAALGPVLSPMAQGGIAYGIGRARQAALPLLENPVQTGVGLESLRRRYLNDE